MNRYLFKEIVIGEEGLLKGPFGSDLKKELYVPKSDSTYKVYLQENILKENNDVGEHYISEEYFKNRMSRYEIKEGDFIVTCDGTLGEIFQLKNITEKGIISSSLLRITLNNDIVDDDYFYYLFKILIKKELIFQGNNSVLKHLPGLNIIREHPIYLPNLDEQKKVVKILKNIDKKIRNNNNTIDRLEEMARTIFDYWILQFEFPNKENRPYKSSGGEMIYNDKLQKYIPNGWGITTIDNITKCHDYKRIPLSDKERVNKKGNIPYYGATGIMDYINDYIFDGDYILVAEDGSVMNKNGNPILQRITGKTWVNNHAHVLEPVKGYSCKLLMMLLKDISIIKIKTGSIQMKINQENLKKIVIPEIPNKILKKLNYQLEIIDNHQLQLKLENEKLSGLRDFLLPLLMSGKVGVKN